MTAVAPWGAAELDPERAVAELARRFPRVLTWYGEYTGSWWAMLRDRNGRDHLVEAHTPAELGRRLEEIFWYRQVSRYARPPARTPARTGARTGARTPAGTPRPRDGRPPRRAPVRRRSLLRRVLGIAALR
ncbi:hypothetical protein [Actinomadura sp. 9N407]|uniref:hypothetical protein n=1 Tax=Actinomadura sp. 9N407 TaxID=3375154 RepID=UPI0037A8D264